MIKLLNSNKYGTTTEKEVKNFELSYAFTLPKDYRNFLLENNGGEPVSDQNFFWIQPGRDGSSLHQFFGLHTGPIHLRLTTYVDQKMYGFPRSLLPIADDGLGNFICLGIQPNNYGKVYFLDHDLYLFQSEDLVSGIIQISDSFGGFIRALQLAPNE